MEIYLLRHGIAENDTPTREGRRSRLNGRGAAKTSVVLKSVADGGVRPEIIVSSPYFRARQTAEIAKEFWDTRTSCMFRMPRSRGRPAGHLAGDSNCTRAPTHPARQP